MSLKNASVLALGLTALLSACTTRSKAIEIQQPAKGPTGTVTPGTGDQAEIPISLPSETEMKAYGDTTNMKYRFSYLGYTDEKPIVFTNGAAQIKISGLPVGQSGSVVLDILDGATPKLHGQRDNVILGSGVNNNIGLTLSPSTGGSSTNPSGGNGKTDLSIDVTLDNGSGNGQSGVVTPPSSSGNGSINSNNLGGAANGNNNAGTIDPIATWDGKSFLGNSKWTIVPVNG